MTPPPRDPASVDTLRQAARLFVDSTSLRHAARDIGMSPTGLRGFLEGADPYIKTARKLAEWYVREAQRQHGELTVETAHAAFDLLTKHLPLARRAGAVGAMLDVLRWHTAEANATPPFWLAQPDHPGG
ncbi:MAG TPA: hypothetical protein VF625_01120 [Longimicrobium sp.]